MEHSTSACRLCHPLFCLQDAAQRLLLAHSPHRRTMEGCSEVGQQDAESIAFKYLVSINSINTVTTGPCITFAEATDTS